MKTNTLGNAGLRVSEVCIGASPLGGMPAAYGYDVPVESGHSAVEAVFESAFNFLDTSNEYSDGRSEQRIGDIIRMRGLPEGFILATKADPAPGETGFPGTRIRDSFRESLDRLGVDTVPVYYLHDPERFPIESIVAPGGAIDVMKELREEGLVQHLGIAGRDIDLLRRYIDTGAFEIVLNHNQYTLMDQTAESLIDHAVTAGVAFVNAAPYAGGILAKGPRSQIRYVYEEASASTIARVERLQEICAIHDAETATVALQFSTRNPLISSTVVGISKPERVAQLTAAIEAETTDALWNDIDAFIAESRRQ
jgi:D-threo-aldose 1-dehydrogenase